MKSLRSTLVYGVLAAAACAALFTGCAATDSDTPNDGSAVDNGGNSTGGSSAGTAGTPSGGSGGVAGAAGTGGSGGAFTCTPASTAGAAGAAGGPATPTMDCKACANTRACSELTACMAVANCRAVFGCVFARPLTLPGEFEDAQVACEAGDRKTDAGDALSASLKLDCATECRFSQ